MCTTTGKIYVGSSVNIAKRWNIHRKYLRDGVHPSRHLQTSWNLHGEDKFEFKVLEHVEDKNKLTNIEAQWVEALNANNPCYGYNIRTVVKSNLGLKHSEETRCKISEASKKRRVSKDTRSKMAESHSKRWVITDPNGVSIQIENLRAWCKSHLFSSSAMCSVANGTLSSYHGWKCERIGPKRGSIDV